MTQRSNIVRLRLTDLEKQDWQRAAGGARKLSEWIRSVCNAEVAATLEGRSAESLSGNAETPPASSVVPNAKPVIVGEAIERSVQDETAQAMKPYKPVEQEASAGQCPRWMYHRPGVYCGTCKKVIGK